MDKKSIIGFILIGVILFGYSWYQGEQAEKAREAYLAAQHEQYLLDSIDRAEHPEKYLAEVAEQIANEEQRAAAVAAIQAEQQARLEQSLSQNFGQELVDATKGTEQFYTIENEVLKMTVSTKAVRLATWS